MTNEATEDKASADVAGQVDPLVRRIHAHLGQLPLHVAQRDGARLLLEAVEKIENAHEFIEWPDVWLWADGIKSALGADHANKITDFESELSAAILRVCREHGYSA